MIHGSERALIHDLAFAAVLRCHVLANFRMRLRHERADLCPQLLHAIEQHLLVEPLRPRGLVMLHGFEFTRGVSLTCGCDLLALFVVGNALLAMNTVLALIGFRPPGQMLLGVFEGSRHARDGMDGVDHDMNVQMLFVGMRGHDGLMLMEPKSLEAR